MIRHKTIRQTVDQLLFESGTSRPPVDVKSLAEGRGIVVVEEPLDDDSFSGFLYRSPDTPPIIGVNGTHPPVRKRFTIAHELGHFMLHPRNGVHYDKELVQLRHSKSSDAPQYEEIEANRFAAELLMPETFLVEDIQKIGAVHSDDEKQLRILAKRYGVSMQALTIRLDRLNLLAL